MSAGIFITFEGTDRVGKSTQINLLKGALEAKGIKPVITREPGGTEIGELIREIILDTSNTEMSDVTEMMLYAASRAQHVNEVIIPNLNAGKIIISDRFVDSSIAYQGGARGLGQAVKEVNDYAVRGYMPDITFLLMADTDNVFSRGSGGKTDRIEAEGSDMQRVVAEAYIRIADENPSRIMVIDALRTIGDIHAEIMSRVENLIEMGGTPVDL